MPDKSGAAMSADSVSIRRLDDPRDGALDQLSAVLHAAFADPNTVLELERMQAFLVQPLGQPGRHFCVVVAEAGTSVIGGSVFSYVPATNYGFSEYLVVRREHHAHGIGRLLFDTRRTLLNALAAESGHASCSGMFIEADNPERTPPELQARERETAMDARTRLQVFAHLGFLRVDLEYVQPALGPGKQPVSYLDLLLAPWDAHVRKALRVPAAWITETVCPIWESWSPGAAATSCAALVRQLGESTVGLVSLCL